MMFTLTLLILIKMISPQQQMPFNSFVSLFFLEADAHYSNNCVFLSIPWEVCRFQLCCGLKRFLRTKVWNQITMFNTASPESILSSTQLLRNELWNMSHL